MVGAVGLALVVVGGPVAGSASAAEPLDSFSGMGTGFALRTIVDLEGLPDAAKLAIQQVYAPIAAASGGALPADFPFKIDQRFIETLVDMGTTNKASSLLGSGFKDFDQIAEVTEVGEKTVVTAAQQLPSADLPVLDVTAGELVASIADGPKLAADGTLAKVAAQLEAVGALMPAELQAVFDQLVTAINSSITDAQVQLDAILGDVANTLTETTDPIVGGLLDEAGLGGLLGDPAELTTELQSVIDLESILNPTSLLDGEIASVRGLQNDADTANSGSKVVSSATSRLLGAQALGLVEVGVVNLESVSQAAGVKGSATNESECSVADVRVGTEDAGIAFDGSSLYVNGTAIPVPTGEVAAVKDAIDGVLNTAGISVETCDVAEADADADGTSAAQRVSAFRIEIAPSSPVDVAGLGISAGDQLLSVVIDPTVETSAAAQVAQPQVVDEEEPSLPRTGAAPLATILVGTGLAAAALITRKRFS